MRDNNLLLNIGNAFSKLVLRSPAHKLLSQNTMLITYSGRNTGDLISVPVNYVEADGEILVTSLRERVWWKNLRNGAPVTLTLQGRKVNTWAESIEDPEQVCILLKKYLNSAPKITKSLGFENPKIINSGSASFRESAAKNVIIRIKR